MASDTTEPAPAIFLDGRSNRKRSVALRLAAGLEIAEQGAVVEVWPYVDIRRADGPPALLRLGCVSALPLARVEIEDAAAQAAVAAACPSLDVGRSGPAQTRRIVLWSAAALCSIIVLAIYGIPFA